MTQSSLTRTMLLLQKTSLKMKTSMKMSFLLLESQEWTIIPAMEPPGKLPSPQEWRWMMPPKQQHLKMDSDRYPK